MRKTKKNGENKRKKRLTVIDLLICIIAISAVVYVGFRFFGADDSKNAPTVLYSVSFTIPEEKQDVFKEGEVVLTSDGEYVVGKISKITFSPATKKNYDLTAGIYGDDKVSSDSSDEIPALEPSDVSVDITYNPEISESADDESKEIDIENVVYDTVIEGYLVMTVTVEGELDSIGGNYKLNGNNLKIGDNVEITTRNYAMIGKCIAISNGGNE